MIINYSNSSVILDVIWYESRTAPRLKLNDCALHLLGASQYVYRPNLDLLLY